MVWNQPGDNKNGGPWGKKPGQGNAAPDLDKVLKDIQNKFNQFLGRSSLPPEDSDKPKHPFSGRWILGLVVALWFLSGIYIVKPAEKAVVLRAGKYLKTVGDGPHWAPSIVDKIYKVDEQHVFSYSYSADMLTKDENIVNVNIAIQYRISNARDFLFNISEPIVSLQESTASALRQVIGNTTLDSVLTSGRDSVRDGVQDQLSDILNSYHSGIQVVDVALHTINPPDEVKEAFDDAISAEQDRDTTINQARAYQEKVIPEAQGQAQRLLAGARAYKQQVVLNAQGETARFLAMLPEYHANPKVMRERLYLATVESVLSKTSKLFIDVNKGNQLFLNVPVDKMLEDNGDADNPVDANADISGDDKQTAAMTAAANAAATANNPSGSYLDNSNSASSYFTQNQGAQQ